MRPDPVPTATTIPLEPPEIVPTDSHRVWCDGGVGALGHPRVYLEMGASSFVECPYCDRRFVLSGHEHREDDRLDPAASEGSGANRL